jgi:hypothetical protein
VRTLSGTVPRDGRAVPSPLSEDCDRYISHMGQFRGTVSWSDSSTVPSRGFILQACAPLRAVWDIWDEVRERVLLRPRLQGLLKALSRKSRTQRCPLPDVDQCPRANMSVAYTVDRTSSGATQYWCRSGAIVHGRARSKANVNAPGLAPILRRRRSASNRERVVPNFGTGCRGFESLQVRHIP